MSDDTLMETISAGAGPQQRSVAMLHDPLVISVVTQKDIPPRLAIQTPGHMPDYVIAAVTPIMAVFTRAAKTYVNTLVGLLGAALAVSGTEAQFVPPGTFLHTLQHVAGLAIAPAVMSLLTNAGLLLSKLDQKFPSLQA